MIVKMKISADTRELDGMNRNKNKIDILTYPIFNRFEELLHFTSTRKGGVSRGNYESLNLGRFSDDKAECIQENFSLFLSEINITAEQLHLPFQTHGDVVFNIDSGFLTKDKDTRQEKLHGVDALVTNLPNCCIGVSTADCVPILLYDPVCRAVGAAHAGWRGTCARIAAKTVRAMQENFHSGITDLKALIGPSISPEVYEVGTELITYFENENFETSKIFFKKGKKHHLDLWEANKLILLEAGLPAENIAISGYCTFTEHEQFFSARRLGIKSGRIISGIMLK